MPESPLFALYRLHLVDFALHDMRKRAASLDGGKAIADEVAKIKAEHRAILERPGEIDAEVKELENKNSIYADKIKSLEAKLYGGSVVNSKEAAGFEQEIESLKSTIDKNEMRSLELLDELPQAQGIARPIQVQIANLVREFTAKKKSDQEESVSLQAAFKAKSAERAPLAAEVDKPLLAQYDAIRQKYGGIGMSVVEKGSCGACGTLLPTKVIDSLDLDKVITCESCHRLLIKLVPGS
ncbi:MAG: hypothetical protein JNK63_06450 [Chthonomonas sp.]|nr:hypothetical protein [Chthonomonas sp.]